MKKMRQANELQSDLEEAFEEGSIITERPDKKILTEKEEAEYLKESRDCLLYTSPSPRDGLLSRMPSSA